MGFSIELEVMSLIILAIIGLFHYDRRDFHNRKYQWFNTCLIVTAVAIIMNLLSCIMLEDIAAYPIGLHVLVNSLYFLAINSSMSLVAAYIFYLVFAHMREQKCYKIATTAIIVFYVIVVVLLIANIWNGCYFYFKNNQYCRGPFNRLGFFVIIVELAMFCMCYFRNRKIVTPYAGHLIRTLPPIVMIFSLAQFLIPNTIMTGTIAALVNLIVFACFQNNRIGRDALTELPNRTSFFRELNYHRKKGRARDIILIHLCNLDKVNKRFSMKVGDALLYNVARYLENLKSGYQVFRYGNTHFMMFGDFSTAEAANKVADEIYERFKQPWEIKQEQWTQQIQMIHMMLSVEEMDENLLTDRLNYLLTKTKDVNYSTRVYFDDELKKTYERKQYVLEEVKKALNEETFVLNFQPVYCCKANRFVSAEVLLRLYTQDGTLISPGEFIPIAEENGLTDAISWFVLKNSMEFLARYPELPLESISINMTIEQMKKPYLDEKLSGVEDVYVSLADRLRVEITEDTITKNPALVKHVMNTLGEVGIKFYLDDFGMGYSNFSRVFDLPFEIVKLDRSLMVKIDEDEKAYQILKNLVDMLHHAGFTVLAEGIERETQVEKAKQCGIDRIQGFYFAKPMSEYALLKLLKDNMGI